MVVEQAQIDAWKQAHGAVYQVTVNVAEGETAVCYLKKAGRNVVAYALTQLASNRLLEAGEFILDNCFIGGDERFKTDEDIRIAGAQQAAGVVQVMQGELVKR